MQVDADKRMRAPSLLESRKHDAQNCKCRQRPAKIWALKVIISWDVFLIIYIAVAEVKC